MSGFPKVNHAELVKLRGLGWKMQDLACRYGVTKAAISHRLSRQVSRRNKPNPAKPCLCGCGVMHKRRKFASQDCYFRYVVTTKYVPWKTGQRWARRQVERVYPLKKPNIVHHVDGDCRNNDLANLWVFESHREHMSFHRGGQGKPIWKGIDFLMKDVAL